ncbi:MAG TPA: hypothetical protein VN886_07400 [Acidimicrobiales bacterium]|nr:hypothetical protein [Acidimicrobiales bacterium]
MSKRSSRTGLLMAALMAIGIVGTGCSAISKVKQTVHNVEGNRATIDSFTQKINAGQNVPFQATYTTTGSSPATIVYAVNPSTNELAFHLTMTGQSASSTQFIVNSSGNYLCTQSSSGSSWSCNKLDKASAADEQNVVDFYTPSHWVNFLKGVSLVAGLAGDKVGSSTMSISGFNNMSCVDLVAKGVAGTSTICTTQQNILGYVKVAQDSTSFQITNYSGSPSASLFQLPPGATVTTVTLPTTTTTT